MGRQVPWAGDNNNNVMFDYFVRMIWKVPIIRNKMGNHVTDDFTLFFSSLCSIGYSGPEPELGLTNEGTKSMAQLIRN